MASTNAARAAPALAQGSSCKTGRLGGATEQLNNRFPATNQVLLTAIPANHRWWRLKAVNYDGDTVILPGVFPGRLQALGAAVLLAEQCGGTVRP